MSRITLITMGAILLGVAACSQTAPAPEPVSPPVIPPEPVFTGKP